MSEKTPENRDVQAENLLEILDRSGAYELCQELLESESLINKMSFDDFEAALQRINGVARDIPIKERRFDGENVYLKGWVDETQVVRHADNMMLQIVFPGKIFST